MSSFGLSEVRIRGYRSLLDVALRPGRVAALVGEANAGKSNVLSAIRALLDPGAPMPTTADASVEGDGQISIEAGIHDGGYASLTGVQPRFASERERVPPVVFLPSALRSGQVVAASESADGSRTGAAHVLRQAVRDLGSHRHGPSDTAAARALVQGLEACCEAEEAGTLVLIEEPELFLGPHAQRYLYRLLERFAAAGNQVIYSTHAPAFLNVARLEEFALVERAADGMTRIIQPDPLDLGEEFRVMSEFDAERSELFLSRAAILVEGRTERLTFPFIFRALGHDADREAISILECGGKSGIPLFAGVCRAVGVPFVAVHDRDAAAGDDPIPAEQALNAEIARSAGSHRTVVLEPDFEGAAGLHGHKHKPERAWQRFRSLSADDVPEPLARAVALALEAVGD